MSNQILTIKDVTREALRVLHQESQLAKHAVRKYQDRFGNRQGQIGTTIDIRKPPRYGVVSGTDVTGQLQDSTEDFVTIDASATSATGGRKVVPLQFSTQDLSLKINDFSKQFIRPAVSRLAREIDLAGFNVLKNSASSRVVRNAAGTNDPTTAISFNDYNTMAARLTTQLAPESDRKLFASAMDHAGVVNSNKGLFQAATQIADQYEKGYMGTSASFDWVSSQNVPSIMFPAVPTTTVGTLTVAVSEGDNAISVTGGTASSTLKAGQGLVLSVYAIDPETQAAVNYKYTAIVAADAQYTSGGNATIYLAEPLYTIATNRTVANVYTLPNSGDTIGLCEQSATSLANKTGNLLFGVQADALALAVVGLEVPGGVDMGASESFEGLGLRITRQWNSLTDQWICRVETQFGWALLRKELVSSAIGLVA